MECIVHYELIRGEKVSPLRGVVDVEPGHKPSVNELLDMFKDSDLHVVVDDPSRLTFRSTTPDDKYTIRVKKFDTGEKNNDYVEDTELKSIISNFIPKSRPL
ncbi:hypothetical protein BVG16_14780 [Paenibacillus selenitireducens]|uniref:Uncharacterized protein n=1 Tax=Paenibacillus selenitireducens TaxID=1324314 RepID=A0A1T2XDA9_9BACL|nr:hypothetical protein BVG16_14780 [Paenibacillus selenitireducens]